MPFNFVAMLCLGKMTEKFYFQFGWYVAEIYEGNGEDPNLPQPYF
jgi:hypothetical protein